VLWGGGLRLSTNTQVVWSGMNLTGKTDPIKKWRGSTAIKGEAALWGEVPTYWRCKRFKNLGKRITPMKQRQRKKARRATGKLKRREPRLQGARDFSLSIAICLKKAQGSQGEPPNGRISSRESRTPRFNRSQGRKNRRLLPKVAVKDCQEDGEGRKGHRGK